MEVRKPAMIERTQAFDDLVSLVERARDALGQTKHTRILIELNKAGGSYIEYGQATWAHVNAPREG